MFKKFIILFLLPLYCWAHDLQQISDFMHNRVVFLTGYPGSGKGTQGKKIADLLQISHLSTGELFRAEAKKGTEIGLAMEAYMNRGEIIPKELVFNYLRQELSDPKYRHGILLDGYPKDQESCVFIMQTLKDLQYDPALALYFEITRDEVVARLTGRLHCADCEIDFHKVYLRPKEENTCDFCGGELVSRDDDTVAAIHQRLDMFEFKTKPVHAIFKTMNIFMSLNAAKTPDEVTDEILATLEKKANEQIYQKGSYFLRNPKKGEEHLSVFHNHIDAKDHLLLREIVRQIEADSLDYQNKIYPVRNLLLGPQTRDPAFSDVYMALPNFHPINNASDEAFCTGKMGDVGFNYDQIRSTLSVVSQYPNQGVMTELEEEVYCKVFKGDLYNTIIEIDRGNTPDVIDWTQLPGWREKQIDNVPLFELHHGFDLAKEPGQENLPIDLEILNQLTEDEFSIGGWFVFRKDNCWAYRTNEFSNDSYECCMERLQKQALQLRAVIMQMKGDSSFESSCSLEKVHAIWRI